jgi:glycosyltransferase involved in cell wall biosynthesis
MIDRTGDTSPRLSIVTVTMNSAATVRHTIESVFGQTYDNIEYIVVDGGSTDGTLEILREYGPRIARSVSEPDRGIYDAMNKGIGLATGEVIGFINSDDFYPRPDSVTRMMAGFTSTEIDACYADICYVRPEDTYSIVRYWRSTAFRPGAFLTGWCPPHPTFLVRRAVYERLGRFDLSYGIASDIELMMRFLEVHRIRAEYVPGVLVHMRMGGETNRSLTGILRQNRQIWRAMKHHGLRPSLARFAGGKLVSRGRQFVTRPISEHEREMGGVSPQRMGD